jgi:uracil-DNA glycosylase family 4
LSDKPDKEQRLLELRKACIEFFNGIYKDKQKILVFGEGNVDARMVLVGEAPGEQETIKQRPFVGQAGKNLDEFLDIVGINREDIYITNTVRFRPFKVNPKTGRTSNRPPRKEEIELCRPWLYKELGIIMPELVVSLGNTPLRVLADDKNISIGDVHGKPMDIKTGQDISFKLFPLYHPASIIYKRALKDVYIEDLNRLKDYLK